LGDAYGRDREFFEFYRTLKAYEASMGGSNTTMVISPDSPFFKYFQKGHTGAR
jgi:membrane protease subunit HflC